MSIGCRTVIEEQLKSIGSGVQRGWGRTGWRPKTRYPKS